MSAPDPWNGLSLAQILSPASISDHVAAEHGIATHTPAAAAAAAADDRPVPGNGRSSYNMDFIDMENEWERINEYDVQDAWSDNGSEASESAVNFEKEYESLWEVQLKKERAPAGEDSAVSAQSTGESGWSASRLSALDEYVLRQNGVPPSAICNVIVAVIREVTSDHATISGFRSAHEVPKLLRQIANARQCKLKEVLRQSECDHCSIECSICLDSFKMNNTVIILSCSHTFHFKCMPQWLWTHDNCPMCRTPITA